MQLRNLRRRNRLYRRPKIFVFETDQPRCGFRKLWRANSGKSGHLRLGLRGAEIFESEMFGSHRRAVKREQAAALQDSIDDRECEVVIMEHSPPRAERLVRSEDHRAAPLVPVVDDV